MALCGKLARPSPHIFQKTHLVIPPPIQRSFLAASTARLNASQSQGHSSPKYQFQRAFATSPKRKITGEEAPSSKAYISSGVLSGQKDLVDVKKVLVIGSGGLSIGQAGEFDYSGMIGPMLWTLKNTTFFIGFALEELANLMGFHRFSGPQSSQRSQCLVDPHQPKHSNHTNGPQTCRRGLLPPSHARICNPCYREGET